MKYEFDGAGYWPALSFSKDMELIRDDK